MTIIVPVLNGAHVLPLTADAVLAQPVARIVYVDDGSTDATPEALRALETRDERISVITFEHNRGRAAARNAGASGASGPLLFLDADVAPSPGYTEAMASALGAPEAIAAVGRLTFPALDPRDPYHRYLASSRRGPASGGGTTGGGGVPWRYFIAGVAAVQARALAEAGGFPESIRYGEDLALACRLSGLAPNGLRHAPEAEAALFDLGDLDTALEKLSSFVQDLPQVLEHCPRALEVAGLTRIHSAALRDRALRWVGARSLPARAVRGIVPRLPASMQPLAVRYLLGHTLLANVPSDVHSRIS